MALTLVQVSGMGLSLVGTTIEQDAAYWEVHIDVPDDDKGTAYEVMFGVATKKDRKFYNALAELEEGRWCGVCALPKNNSLLTHTKSPCSQRARMPMERI
jgi:hypothetical protein